MKLPSILLFLLLLISSLAFSTLQDESHPSLLELKLKLAEDSRPYLHLTPEGIFVYFKTILVKSLPIERLEPEPQGALQISRVDAWAPPVDRPTLFTDSDPDEAFDLLEVIDMPKSFIVLLDNEDVWAVNPAQTGSPVSRHKEIFELLREIHPTPHLINSGRVTVIHLEETSAQQLYWLLQERLAVIH